jgi:hypothetical protein
LDESAETEAKGKPVACEALLPDGRNCLVETHYFASYSEGDAFPMCLPHLMLAMEEVRRDKDLIQEVWTISYA